MDTYEALGSLTLRKLKAMIVEGELDFDTIYSESKLAAQLNVSRTPVRDALTRLKQARYIDIIPNKGFMLHKPDVDDIENAAKFRCAIEGYCAATIAENSKSEYYLNTVSSLEETLSLQRAVADELHLKRFWKLDTQFHTTLVSCLHNPYFDSLFGNCNYLFTSLSVSDFFSVNRHISTIQDHQAIIDAIKDGNPDAARMAAVNHIEESLRVILDDKLLNKEMQYSD